MILQRHSHSVSRRTAFTLLEVLVVVAIILVLASVATVAVLQIQKESNADIAKIQANSLAVILRTYMLKNDGIPPNSIEDLLPYVEGGNANRLNDPWNVRYQIGTQEMNNVTSYYIFTHHPETGAEIRSDAKK